MHNFVTSNRVGILIVSCAAISSAAHGGGDPPASDSPLVKLLKSGRVPEARQGTIVEMIGKRGTAADLDYIYQQALMGGSPAPIRVKALEALAEAALTRGLKPARDRDRLIGFLQVDLPRSETGLVRSAVRLAGLWRLEAA